MISPANLHGTEFPRVTCARWVKPGEGPSQMDKHLRGECRPCLFFTRKAHGHVVHVGYEAWGNSHVSKIYPLDPSGKHTKNPWKVTIFHR
jgi:hypothetical protein